MSFALPLERHGNKPDAIARFQSVGLVTKVLGDVKRELPRHFPEQFSTFAGPIREAISQYVNAYRVPALSLSVTSGAAAFELGQLTALDADGNTPILIDPALTSSKAKAYPNAAALRDESNHLIETNTRECGAMLAIYGLASFDEKTRLDHILKRLEYLKAVMAMLATTDMAGSSQVLGSHLASQSAHAAKLMRLGRQIDHLTRTVLTTRTANLSPTVQDALHILETRIATMRTPLPMQRPTVPMQGHSHEPQARALPASSRLVSPRSAAKVLPQSARVGAVSERVATPNTVAMEPPGRTVPSRASLNSDESAPKGAAQERFTGPFGSVPVETEFSHRDDAPRQSIPLRASERAECILVVETNPHERNVLTTTEIVGPAPQRDAVATATATVVDAKAEAPSTPSVIVEKVSHQETMPGIDLPRMRTAESANDPVLVTQRTRQVHFSSAMPHEIDVLPGATASEFPGERRAVSSRVAESTETAVLHASGLSIDPTPQRQLWLQEQQREGSLGEANQRLIDTLVSRDVSKAFRAEAEHICGPNCPIHGTPRQPAVDAARQGGLDAYLATIGTEQKSASQGETEKAISRFAENAEHVCGPNCPIHGTGVRASSEHRQSGVDAYLSVNWSEPARVEKPVQAPPPFQAPLSGVPIHSRTPRHLEGKALHVPVR